MVNRCVCSDVPFWAIAALAKQGKTFEQIRDATDCCRGCGTCEPYVRVVIKTLAVDLPVLSPAQQSAIMAEAEAAERHPAPSTSTPPANTQ